ncbi:MAG: protein kinase [Kiritimatiellae bacterium]|nr:protein kinase [Kiritimatiellia bacterium]
MAEDPHILEIGGKFGDYKVVKLLGVGGMGAVYLLELNKGEYCAAKILNPEMVKKSRSFRRRFVMEAELAMRLQHPNLVNVFDVGEDPDSGLCYILMEYVDGGTLREKISRDGPFPVPAAVRLVRDIASVLMVAQQNQIVHRDIKPDNIMFAADGTPKLADLGIARFGEEAGGSTTVTMSGQMIGTPAYMAPEQMQDAHKVDTRADIYSLGIVFFELLTGKRPNEGEPMMQILAKAMRGDAIPDVRTLRPGISGAVAQLVNIMCVMQVDKRIASAEEVVDLANRLADRVDLEPTPEERIATDVPSSSSPPPPQVDVPTRRALRPVSPNNNNTMLTVPFLVAGALAVIALAVAIRVCVRNPARSAAAAAAAEAESAASRGTVRQCEMPDGRTWFYCVRDGLATLVNGFGDSAVSPAPDGELEVPAELDGYPVVRIGERAFENCAKLTAAHLAPGITSIAAGAFRDCARLQSVSLPDTLTEIGELAFAGTALVNLDFKNVKRLPENLGALPFLETIAVDPQNDAFRVEGGVLYDRDMETLYKAPGKTKEAKLPATLRWIAAGAFAECAVTNVVLPANVGHVGQDAFRNCRDLVAVSVRSRKATFMDGCFGGCVNLERFEAPPGVTTDAENVFAGCVKLHGRPNVAPDAGGEADE